MKRFLIFLIVIFCHTSMPYNISAFTIDSMESLADFSFMSDSGVSYSGSIVPGWSGNCVKISYNFSTGTWVQVYKSFQTISLTNGDTIQFWYKATGNANTLEFYLEDSSSNSKTLYFNRATPTSGWIKKSVSLSYFSNLNLTQIRKIKFGISQQTGDDGGSGTLYIDRVILYQSVSSTLKSNVVDNFDGPDSDYTNALGGVNGSWCASPATIVATNFSSNFCTLKFNYYSTNTDACVWWFLIKGTPYTNISSYEYLRFKIKGYKGGEVIGIGLKDLSATEKYVMLNDYITNITTEFKEVLIPLSDFPGVDLTRIESIQFWFREDKPDMDIPDPGTNVIIYIDDLMFYTPQRTAGVIKEIEDFDLNPSYSSWDFYNSQNSSISVSLAKGYDGYAYKIDYSLENNGWVTIERNFYLNLYKGGGIKFYFKGDGDSNNLEVKLEDSDGTTYWRKFYNFTDTDNQWKEAGISFDELSYFSSGEDDNLNLKKIKTIYIAVSQYETGKQGEVYIDELRCESASTYTKNFTSSEIFQEINADNISFSPDNDGYKDKLTITFKLNKSARVNLKIYDLGGNLIKELSEINCQPDTTYTVEWNGTDLTGSIVRNGLYLFQLKAETSDGEVQRVNYGVLILK